MESYQSGSAAIGVDVREPSGTGPFPALILLHGSGGAASYWLDAMAPLLAGAGLALYAPHYFDKTGTRRATAQTILDGHHFTQWLAASRDLIDFIVRRPGVDARRIGVLGVSLGGYLAVALGAEESRLRAVIELSGGMPPGWESRVTPAMPPVLILHGEEDEVVPAAEAHKLEAVLRGRGVAVSMEIVAREGHWFSQAARLRLLLRCSQFLMTHLRAAPAPVPR